MPAGEGMAVGAWLKFGSEGPREGCFNSKGRQRSGRAKQNTCYLRHLMLENKCEILTKCASKRIAEVDHVLVYLVPAGHSLVGL